MGERDLPPDETDASEADVADADVSEAATDEAAQEEPDAVGERWEPL